MTISYRDHCAYIYLSIFSPKCIYVYMCLLKLNVSSLTVGDGKRRKAKVRCIILHEQPKLN